MVKKFTTSKRRYRGYSLGNFYYRYANSLAEAKRLLRSAALESAGRYNFTEIAIEDPPNSGRYQKIYTTIT